MDPFTYYTRDNLFYIPRTPNSALLGISKGMVPKEAYISLSLFMESPFISDKLNSENIDKQFKRITELERIIAKKDRDLETEILLMKTLQEMVFSKNSEIALFASESLNGIENLYNDKIFQLKNQLVEKFDILLAEEFINVVYRYGCINQNRIEVRDFYFDMLLNYINESIDLGVTFNNHIILIEIEVLIEIENYDKALEIISQSKISEWDALFYRVEIEYKQKNFIKITELLSNINRRKIPMKYKESFTIWMD